MALCDVTSCIIKTHHFHLKVFHPESGLSIVSRNVAPHILK